MVWLYDVSNKSRCWLEFLGNFRPTCNQDRRELKGFIYDKMAMGRYILRQRICAR